MLKCKNIGVVEVLSNCVMGGTTPSDQALTVRSQGWNHLVELGYSNRSVGSNGPSVVVDRTVRQSITKSAALGTLGMNFWSYRMVLSNHLSVQGLSKKDLGKFLGKFEGYVFYQTIRWLSPVRP